MNALPSNSQIDSRKQAPAPQSHGQPDERQRHVRATGSPVPRFSIIVPAYNANMTIRETLDSILAQAYTDWECIVIDDGSQDDTASIAAEYCAQDQRLRLIRQANAGAAGAYTTGVRASAGRLIAICASDDMLLPRHLTVMDELIARHPDYDIFSCNGQYLAHETGETTQVYQQEPWLQERSLSLAEVLGNCFFGVGAVYRRSVFDLIGGYRPGVYADDYDFWLRALAQGARHYYTPEVLSVFRRSTFHQSADVIRVHESEIEVYENLIASGALDSEHQALAESSIAERRQLIAEHRADLATWGNQGNLRRKTAWAARDAERLRRVLGRILPERRVDSVIRCAQRAAWLIRPIRNMIWRLRLKEK